MRKDKERSQQDYSSSNDSVEGASECDLLEAEGLLLTERNSI
jgi:hypothetical protein